MCGGKRKYSGPSGSGLGGVEESNTFKSTQHQSSKAITIALDYFSVNFTTEGEARRKQNDSGLKSWLLLNEELPFQKSCDERKWQDPAKTPVFPV